MSRFLCILFLVFLVGKISGDCEAGWLRFENKCFKYFQTKMNFRNATQLCKSFNGTIASIHSREEHVFIEDIARHYSTASGVHWVWLGGERPKRWTIDKTTDKNSSISKGFVWQDGSPFNHSEWRFSCPDDRRDEDCILMSVFQSRSSHWCNFKCDSNQDHVMCQYYLKNDENTTDTNSSTSATRESKEETNQAEFSKTDASCDIGWTLNENSCYKFFETNQTWPVANKMCMNNKANLVSIGSEAEQIFVQTFIFTINGALEAVWLGGKRKGPQKQFAWIDNSSFIYENYAPHEPDNRNQKEDCLAMNNVEEFFGQWIDAPCSVTFGVACKKSANRVPGCSTNQLMKELENTNQVNTYILKLLGVISNKIDEASRPKQSVTETMATPITAIGKENDAVALEIKSEVDSILHNSSLIKLSLHLSIFISLVLIGLMSALAVFLFKRRHLIKKPYLSIFAFKNLNYEDKNVSSNEYEELLYNQNHNINPNTSSSPIIRNLSDKV